MADSVNDDLVDLNLRHEVNLHKFANSEVREVLKLLKKSELDIAEQIHKRDASGDTSSFTRNRLEALLDSIKQIISNVYEQINIRMGKTLGDLAEHEVNWQARALEKAIPVNVDLVTPSAQQLRAAVSEIPFDGRLLDEWRDNLTLGAFDRIKAAVRIGYVQGETNEQIVRRIVGTRANGFKDGIANINRKSAESFVRTATSSMANYARQQTFKENADILRGYVWLSALDSHVCAACGALDGQMFDLDDGKAPPLHRGCRCTLVAITKSYRELGIDLDEAAPGTRASMNGQVPAKTTFSEWIRKQPASVQDEILGKTKGKLFRDGGLEVRDFVNNRGLILNLEQLRAVEGAAFTKAGIEK